MVLWYDKYNFKSIFKCSEYSIIYYVQTFSLKFLKAACIIRWNIARDIRYIIYLFFLQMATWNEKRRKLIVSAIRDWDHRRCFKSCSPAVIAATDDVQTLFNLPYSCSMIQISILPLHYSIKEGRRFMLRFISLPGQPVKSLIICILETGIFGLKGFKIAVFKCIKSKG